MGIAALSMHANTKLIKWTSSGNNCPHQYSHTRIAIPANTRRRDMCGCIQTSMPTYTRIEFCQGLKRSVRGGKKGK